MPEVLMHDQNRNGESKPSVPPGSVESLDALVEEAPQAGTLWVTPLLFHDFRSTDVRVIYWCAQMNSTLDAFVQDIRARRLAAEGRHVAEARSTHRAAEPQERIWYGPKLWLLEALPWPFAVDSPFSSVDARAPDMIAVHPKDAIACYLAWMLSLEHLRPDLDVNFMGWGVELACAFIDHYRKTLL